MKLHKKLLSLAAVVGLTIAAGVTVSASASAASPTPSFDGMWVCKNLRTGDITWPVNGRCPRWTEKVLWQPPKNDGHNQRGVALETISFDLGAGGGLKCGRNVSRDPKNAVFKDCVPTGQLAKVLNPAPQPTPTRTISTPTPSATPTRPGPHR